MSFLSPHIMFISCIHNLEFLPKSLSLVLQLIPHLTLFCLSILFLWYYLGSSSHSYWECCVMTSRLGINLWLFHHTFMNSFLHAFIYSFIHVFIHQYLLSITKYQKVKRFYFLRLQNHWGWWVQLRNYREIKRHLLLGRTAMTNLDSIWKKQGHYFANKGPCSQSYGFFPVVMYRCDSWTIRLSAKELMLLNCGAGEGS